MSTENNNYPSMTVKIDRSANEQRLMDEKETLSKEITELKQKEAERLQSDKLAQEEKAKLESEQQTVPKRKANGSVQI